MSILFISCEVSLSKENGDFSTSIVAQWLGLHAFTAGGKGICCLVGELRSHKLHDMAKKKERKWIFLPALFSVSYTQTVDIPKIHYYFFLSAFSSLEILSTFMNLTTISYVNDFYFFIYLFFNFILFLKFT